MGIFLVISQILGYIQAGLTTAEQVAKVIQAGKATLVDDNGNPMTAEQFQARYESVVKAILQTGDNAADRIK